MDFKSNDEDVVSPNLELKFKGFNKSNALTV